MLKVRVSATNPTAATAKVHKRFTAVKKSVAPLIMNQLRKIQATAMNIVANEAYDTGNLYRNIEIYPKNIKGINNSLTASVGPNMRVVRYAEFVEGGHWAGFPNRPKVFVNGVYFMARAVAKHQRNARSNVRSGLLNAFRYYDKGMTHRYNPEMQIGMTHGVKAIKMAARQRFWERDKKIFAKKVAKLKKAGKNYKKLSYRDRRPKRTVIRRPPRRVHYRSIKNY